LIKDEDQGLFEYDGEHTFNHSYNYWIYYNEYMDHQEIESILAHSDGSIWFSTFTGKLVRYNPISYMAQFIPLHSGIAGRISDMIEDENGAVWAMATGGLTKIFSEGGIAIANFEANESVCQGTVIEFENTSTNALSYEWLINDVFVSDQMNLSYIFENTGTQEITLIAYDAYACSNSQSFAIEVSENASIIGENEILELCQLSSATLEAGTENMAYYFWDFNGELVGTTPSITVDVSGIYILSVIDECGGVDTKAYEVVLSDICNNELVLPGDINNDSIVNQYDVLFWGVANEWSGPSRPNASTVWTPQAAPSWTQIQMNEANGVHADADGNGVCDLADAAIIQQNYGLNANDIMGADLDTGAPLFVIEPQYNPANNIPEQTANGNNVTTITIELYLQGTSGTDLSDLSLYGIAGSIELSSLIEGGGSKEIKEIKMIDLKGSCLGEEEQDNNLYGDVFVSNNNNKIDFAIVRLDKQNVNCDNNSLIAKLHVVIDDNLAFELQQEDPWEVAIVEGASITYNAGIDDLGAGFTTLAIEDKSVVVALPLVAEDPDTGTPTPPSTLINMFPNPANDMISIRTGDLFEDEIFVKISNISGQVLYQSSFFENEFKIAVSSFKSGIYHLQIGDGKNAPVIQELMIAH